MNLTKFAKQVSVQHDAANFDIDFSYQDFRAKIPSKSDSLYEMTEYRCVKSQVFASFTGKRNGRIFKINSKRNV